MIGWFKRRSDKKRHLRNITEQEKAYILAVLDCLEVRLGESISPSQYKTNRHVTGSYVRGLIYGYLSQALEGNGIEIKSEGHYTFLMIMAHYYLLNKDFDFSKNYAVQSMTLNHIEDDEFMGAKQEGIDYLLKLVE